MRILHVLAQQHPEQHERAATLLFDAVFARGDTALLHGVAGKDREGEVARLHELLGALLSKEQLGKLWDASVTQEVKDAVKAQAQKCVKEQGAYGVPYTTFERADGKKLSFMGQDRFEIITDW
jgi:2-hydroxychromene-2-carboxylate isomerase